MFCWRLGGELIGVAEDDARTSFLIDQPSLIKRAAKWSSSSGCEGAIARDAKVIDGAHQSPGQTNAARRD